MCAPGAHAQRYNPSIVRYHDHAWSDGGYRYVGGERVVITGIVLRVNDDTGRLALRSDSHHRYNVDTYNAEVISPASDNDEDLAAGTRVRVVGYRYGIGFIDADRVVVLRSDEDDQPVDPQPASAPVTVPAPQVDNAPVDANPLPPVTPSSNGGETVRMEAVIKSVTGDGLTVLGSDGQVYNVKAADTDIILPRIDRAGSLSDLEQGMHVRIIGEHGDAGVINADRIRVLRDDTDAPAAPVAPHPAITDLSVYTGIIIDVRGFHDIQRSPAPAIYAPDMTLLYPDRSHVPTPDEVQDESVVRYYRSEDAAIAGVGGAHPLILEAVSLVGPAEDGVMLSSDDAALFKALDQRLQYTRNWKVGFLIPTDR
jgi:hypothetical protein